MSRILFVRSTPYDEDLSGYNVQEVGIAKAFCTLGHDCDYLNFHTTREEIVDLCQINGHKARAIFRKRIRLLRTGISLRSLNKEFLSQYDIVICREYNQIMTHWIAQRHPNTSMYTGPYWNMFMLPFLSPVYDALYTRKMNRELKCKFVKSQLAREFLEQKGYTDLVDVGVGLDVSRFVDVQCTESTAEIADFMRSHNCLLYIGTLDANKNIPFLLKVFEKVLETRPDTRLVLIGKSMQTLKNKLLGKSNESYYEELIRSVPEHVREAVIHIERVDNPQLQFIYPLAKAFLLPSIFEIFGMVMLEAMYFGAPVITSRNGGSSTLIKSDRFGQKIPEYDPELWAAGVLKYLDDPEYTECVRKNCMQLIRDQYSWVTIAEKMLKCIQAQTASKEENTNGTV